MNECAFKHPFRSGNCGQQCIKLIGKIVQRPGKLSGILDKNHNNTDRNHLIQGENVAYPGDNGNPAIVKSIHQFRNKSGIRLCPETGAVRVSL